MGITIPERIASAKAGSNPAFICSVPSGCVVLCDMQFLRGYTILIADPVVASINDLDQKRRADYLRDMVLIGDALLEVTNCFRINYAIAGNTDPFLHTHIVPRYLSEPEVYRKGLPWSHPKEEIDKIVFDYERDKNLILLLSEAINKRLSVEAQE